MAFDKTHERLAVYVFGVVFIVVMLVIAIAFPEPTAFQYLVFRIVLALAAAGVTAFIPGCVQIEVSNYVRAGGAIAVFVIIYFFSPAELITDRDTQHDRIRSRLLEMIDVATAEPPPYRELKPNVAEIEGLIELFHAKDRQDKVTLQLGEAILAIHSEHFSDAAQLFRQSQPAAQDSVAAADELSWRKIRGDAWFCLGEWAKAANDYQRALEVKPDHIECLSGLANCLAKLKRLPEAEEKFSSLLARYAALRESERGEKWALKLAMTHNNRALTRLRQGAAPTALDDYHAAAEIYAALAVKGSATKVRDDYASTLGNRAMLLSDMGRHAEALQDLNRAVDLRTDIVSESERIEFKIAIGATYSNRGIVLAKMDEAAAAADDFSQTIGILSGLTQRQYPDRDALLAQAHMNRAAIRKQQGRLPEAREDYDQAITSYRRLVAAGRTEYEADLAQTLSNRGIVFVQMEEFRAGAKDHAEALDRYQNLVEDSGRVELRDWVAWAYDNLGDALVGLGDHVKAAEDYRQAVEIYTTLIRDEGRNDLQTWRNGVQRKLDVLGDDQTVRQRSETSAVKAGDGGF